MLDLYEQGCKQTGEFKPNTSILPIRKPGSTLPPVKSRDSILNNIPLAEKPNYTLQTCWKLSEHNIPVPETALNKL